VTTLELENDSLYDKIDNLEESLTAAKQLQELMEKPEEELPEKKESDDAYGDESPDVVPEDDAESPVPVKKQTRAELLDLLKRKMTMNSNAARAE